MTIRMAKLDRVLQLIHALSETSDGLTLDDMANELAVNRRTAEQLRVIIALHFELDECIEERRKRFRIRDSLRRAYTRPIAAEVAALQAEVIERGREQAPQAALLGSLLAKGKARSMIPSSGESTPILTRLHACNAAESRQLGQ